MKSEGGKAEQQVREIALGYPEAIEERPWGHPAIKVRGKAFLFMGTDPDGRFGLSTKLPHSNGAALMLPFAEPTGYGLGKSGWVSASFGPDDEPPLPLLRAWIDESYRAVAPKKLVALLDGGAPSAAAPKKKAAAAKNVATPKAAAAPRKATAARKAPVAKAPAAAKRAKAPAAK